VIHSKDTETPKVTKELNNQVMDDFLPQLFEQMMSYIRSRDDRSVPVIRFAGPSEIVQQFEAIGVPLSLLEEDNRTQHSSSHLLAACKTVIDYSVRTSHPYFLNQLFGRPDLAAVGADWLTTLLNTQAHTYEVAPVFVLMEREVLKKVATTIGPPFQTSYDGLLCPGGSISILYSIQLARYKACPEIKTKGQHACPAPLVAFTSKHSHYSLVKLMGLLGLGTNNLVKVDCDPYGRLLPAALEQAITQSISRGEKPFYVNATAGSTVLGAFDPFTEIADLAKKYGLWFHVDGCWGGCLSISKQHRHILAGVEKADSFCWNPHKMTGIPVQCSIFLTSHSNLLIECNAVGASYLFQKDKNFSELDPGDKTIQCGRHVDSFKLWLSWKAHGDHGLEEKVNHSVSLAQYMIKKVKERESHTGSFVLVVDPTKDSFSFVHTCFWYIPKGLRPFNILTSTEEQRKQLHSVAPSIKNEMQREGSMLIGYQPLDQFPNFFRAVFLTLTLTFQDIDIILDSIERIGEKLYGLVK